MAGRIHPIPSRTRKLSSPAPMILHLCGKVGRRQIPFAERPVDTIQQGVLRFLAIFSSSPSFFSSSLVVFCSSCPSPLGAVPVCAFSLLLLAFPFGAPFGRSAHPCLLCSFLGFPIWGCAPQTPARGWLAPQPLDPTRFVGAARPHTPERGRTGPVCDAGNSRACLSLRATRCSRASGEQKQPPQGGQMLSQTLVGATLRALIGGRMGWGHSQTLLCGALRALCGVLITFGL